MSASEAVEEFERAVLEANVPLAALHEVTGVSGDARMRELAARIAFPSWPGATSATVLKRAAQEAEITAVLDEYAEEVAQVIEDVAQQQTKVFESRGEYLVSEAFGKRKGGGRRLARLGRRHRAELVGVDMRRWTSFIEPLSHASTTSLRSTVQKVHKRGLGAAALTELGVRADAESVKAFTKDSEKRKNSSWRV